jgi:AcrR family transcriptional regulator
MARKKSGEMDTRAALLDAAWALFQEHGYEAVPVDTIARRAGLSKGTFFHYFPTKVDLLEQVCDHVTGPPWAALIDRVGDRSLSARARLGLLLEGTREWRLRHTGVLLDLYRALTRPENTLLRVRLAARQVELFGDALAKILADGTREGVLSVADPDEMARLVCAVVRCAGERSLRQAAAADRPDDPRVIASAARRGATAATAVERMLGMKTGSLKRAGAAALKRKLGVRPA